MLPYWNRCQSVTVDAGIFHWGFLAHFCLLSVLPESFSLCRWAMQAQNHPLMLSDKMREVLRLKHYSLRTEEAYLGWVRRFVRFHGGRHPRELAENEVRAFLTHLAAVDNVAAATQNQAVNALVFLYRAVLEKPLGDFSQMLRARAVRRLPVIFTRAELATKGE